MIHTNMPRKCTVFLLTRRPTRSAIYGSQILDSHKWPTVLVRAVKGKPRNFEANLCGSLYSTFKTSFQPYAFYNKQLTLFIDQLVQSKATCSFKQSTFEANDTNATVLKILSLRGQGNFHFAKFIPILWDTFDWAPGQD